jgi:hypothetical protein
MKKKSFFWNENISVFPSQFANLMTDTSLFGSKLVLGRSIRSGCCQISKCSSAKNVTRFDS